MPDGRHLAVSNCGLVFGYESPSRLSRGARMMKQSNFPGIGTWWWTRSGLFGLLDDKKSILPSDTLYSYCPCWIVVPLELIPLSRVGDGLTGVTTHRCLLYQLTGPQIWLYKKRSLMVEASTWIQHPGQSSYVPSIWKICPKSRESD